MVVALRGGLRFCQWDPLLQVSERMGRVDAHVLDE